MTQSRLERFRDSVEGQQRNGEEVGGRQRSAIARDVFPSLADLAVGDVEDNWMKLFGPGHSDPSGVFGRIMSDILKADQAEPGRSGPRPAIDPVLGAARLRQMAGADYSTLPFAEAFRCLVGSRSTRHVASKTGLDRTRVWRLQKDGKGSVAPTKTDMEAIAKGFGKRPSYFLEYRVRYLVAGISDHLVQLPEASVDYYRQSVFKRGSGVPSHS